MASLLLLAEQAEREWKTAKEKAVKKAAQEEEKLKKEAEKAEKKRKAEMKAAGTARFRSCPAHD